MARYLVSGGTGNWNSTTNWSATSGGASGASFPVAGDDVIIDANSLNANLIINVASACATLTFANVYTGNLTWNTPLTMTGNLVLGTGMTITRGVNGAISINGNISITSAGQTIAGITPTLANGICTLVDDLRVGGNLQHTTTGGAFVFNGNKLYFLGATVSMSSGRTVNGTSEFITSGINHTFSGTTFNTPLTFNHSGTVTYSATANFAGSRMKWISGAVDFTTNNNFFTITGSCGFEMGAVVIKNIIIGLTGAGTVVTNYSAVPLRIGTLSIAANCSFDGVSGFDVDSFSGTVSSRTYTLKAGNTYRIRNSITNTFATSGGHNKFKSDTAGAYAFLILDSGATQDLSYIDAEDIDSSGGQTWWSYKPVLTNTLNWKALTVPQTLTIGNFN